MVRFALRSSLLAMLLGAFSLIAVQAADPSPLRTISDPNPNFHGVWVDTVNNELVVSDDNTHSVQVFGRTASGAAAPLRTIRGLSTGLDFPSYVVADTVNNELWAVMDDTSDRAEAFSRTANGDVAPLRIIDFKGLAPNVNGHKRTYGWAVDTVNNEVAGSFQTGSAIYFFNRTTGADIRSIFGPATSMADPHGIAIDTVNNEVLVVNEGHVFGAPTQAPSITVFSRTASGNVAPLRTISGALTGLVQPKHLRVDTTNNEIYVVNGTPAESITVYNRTATGNVAPLRTISGALTGLNNPAGVHVDTVNNEVVVTNWGNHSVTVYPRTATGNVAPLRTLTSNPGGAQVGIGNPGATSADTVNNEIAVTNCVSHPRVAIFPRTANGQVAPTRVLQGQNTRLSRSMHGVAIDSVNNEIFVPSTLEDAILVFNRTDSGDVAPKRVIQGSLTGINKPQGIAIDTVNNEIALANEASLTWTVYDRLANGNVAPKRTISDATASMSKPVGIWIDSVNNEIVVTDGGSSTAVGAELIQVYPRLASGPTTPLRQIGGTATMLISTRQVMVDTVNNEIVVANQGHRAVNPPDLGNISVFDRLANGNVAPKRFVQNATPTTGNSGVRHPRSVWVDATNNEIGAGDSKYNDIRIFDRLFGTGTPDFTVSAAPASQTVTQGASTTYTVSVNPSGGFTGAVTLSVSGLPAGATGSFNPNPITAPTTSTLTVQTAATTPTGTSTLTITGVSGALSRNTSVTLVVIPPGGGDFSLSATPAVSPPVCQTDPPPQTTYTVTVTPIGGFTGSVTLSVSGLPAGTTGSFSPNPTTTTSTLSITVSDTTPDGTFTLTITGVSGAVTHTTTVQLVVDRTTC
jgi:6-phosphogluconolactonase (cycloisomerase 2 family)